DALDPMPDRVFDGLVVAQLEMQARVVLDGAPVAAVEAVAADHVQRAGDRFFATPRDHEQAALARRGADQREGAAVEVGPAPLARAGIHVKGEERIPMRLRDLAPAQPFDGKTLA